MPALSQVYSDFKVIRQLLLSRPKGESQKEKMDSFYLNQADEYDSFREKLLPGRAAMMEQVFKKQIEGKWIDIGAGTGKNLELAGHFADNFTDIFLLDICKPLLLKAENKITQLMLNNVTTVCQDILAYNCENNYFDLITFSYSLTMMPDWSDVLKKVFNILKPGGTLGIVDFSIHDNSDNIKLQKNVLYNKFWQKWFAYDGVYLNSEHIRNIKSNFDVYYLMQAKSKICYMPFIKAPYYILICKKPLTEKLSADHKFNI